MTRPIIGSGYSSLEDLAWTARWLTLGKGIDVVHALDDLSPDRILTVKEGRIIEHDEKLRVCAIGIGRPGH